MKKGIFITGTDTGVGKTFVSSLLVSSLKSHGLKAGYFKPVQTGDDDDSARVAHLSGLSRDQISSPVYSFPLPAAPSRAAAKVGATIQLGKIQEKWDELKEGVWVVEGAGGLMVPLNSKETILDLIQAMQLRIILVASTRLGTINHTLLTLNVAERAGIYVIGIVLNGDEDPGPELQAILKEHTQVPVLSRIPNIPELSPEIIPALGMEYFPSQIIESIF